MEIKIRRLNSDDPAIIEDAFREQGWHKPAELFERYLAEQEAGLRVTLVAEADGAFAGYGSVIWQPDYPPFREQSIPEISDLNVLIRFRKQGIASRLMDRAEQEIAERSSSAGIGVGLFADYGQAQIMYVKRGYVPDGRGLYMGDRQLQYGDNITVDDDLVLYLTKKLSV
ncbi:GNAT family N-acetyltransferase [Saccharibacillus sp. O23]|uniref:GNAT family N-acetyltransferase n=1 Tax=Saccharibacillus sp. O23 TaxID=2009338 RepID=UPI000B4E3A7C|nr:GNAT family N-acetyltransferase [Saccharibacillus sp. O23]OWR32374.1 GNAT family N-acetyltransferase [Saccharibacillus sp. O23]